MDMALILYTEHEFNAGSFGVRVAASAHSDLYSSVIAGECILRGPRHGCANEEVMKMLMDQGGNPDTVKQYLDDFFAQPGARMPGFGHAVYNLPHSYDPRVTDPATLGEGAVAAQEATCAGTRHSVALEEYMAERMKPRVERGQPNAPANMDLWTAPLYYLLGIPIPMYTPLFAASRIAGWAAHYLETRYVNNEPILRPRAEYAGPRAARLHAASPDLRRTGGLRWRPRPTTRCRAHRLRREAALRGPARERGARDQSARRRLVGNARWADSRTRACVERWSYLSKRPIAYEAGGLAYGVPHKLSLCDAAFLNSTMTRWLDFNDTYLAKEPAHPSDNFRPLCSRCRARSSSRGAT